MKRKYPTAKMNAATDNTTRMKAKSGLIGVELDGFSGSTTGANWTIFGVKLTDGG
jgi:hypothetical protein